MAVFFTIRNAFYRQVLLTVCLLLFCLSVLATPRVTDPSFLRLNTSSGLTQDEINDIVADKDGFIWIATEGGLSRWDGYRFKSFPGPGDLLTNASVTNLFIDSRNCLWISTYNSGVHVYDLKNNRFHSVSRRTFKNEPDWVQGGYSFDEAPNGDIYIGFEQAIVYFERATGKETVIYELDEQSIESNDAIRDVVVVDDALLIATSGGLFLRDETGMVERLNYLGEVTDNKANTNVKTLRVLDDQTVLVGTVEGLFWGKLETLLDTHQQTGLKLIVPNRNIWTIKENVNGAYWLGTDIGLMALTNDDEAGWQYHHVLEPSAGEVELASKQIRALLPDRQGNLWLGTKYGGLLFWYSRPLEISTYQNNRFMKERLLTNNTVWSIYQEDRQHLWVGTDNGLTYLNLDTNMSSFYLYNEDLQMAEDAISIDRIYPADDDHLLIQTYEGLRLFSKKTGKMTLPPVSDGKHKTIFEDWTFGSAIDEKGRIYFLGDSFYRYDYASRTVEQLAIGGKQFSALFSNGFLGIEPRFGNRMFLAMMDGLWLLDTETLDTELVYEFPPRQRNNNLSVSSWVVDNTDTLWLGFPRFGLFALDANTFNVKEHFTTENLLESDIVYSLRTDKRGDIWFSSHGALNHYSPFKNTLKAFHYGQDLRVSEFNEGASLELQDGRLAYGSTSGLIIFDPLVLERHRSTMPVLQNMVISDVLLDSRSLKGVTQNLSGESLSFRHDDYGITIQFSPILTSLVETTRLRYRLLRGNTLVSEAVTSSGGVTFAFLAPGDYYFEVAPVKQDAEVTLLPATLSFTIPYPPLRSPSAYALYILLLLCLIAVYLYHRQRQLATLQTAQKQVRLFGDAFQHTRDWVIIYDKDLEPVAVNPACSAVFGLSKAGDLKEQVNRLFERTPKLHRLLTEKLMQLDAGEFWKNEEHLVGADDRHYDVLLEVSANGDLGKDKKAEHYLIVMSDITEQKNAERKLLKVANYDDLTGLVNRALLLQRLEHTLERACARNYKVAVLFVDLDRFKGINDSLGHDYGDKLLRVVASRMKNLTPSSDTVARLGGDEFVIVRENVPSPEALSDFVDKLIETVETPITLGKEVVRVSASVGGAFYPQDATLPSELLKQADVAMYSAKKDTLNRFAYFTSEMDDKARERLNLENRVKVAYEESRFFNHYQPVVDARNGRIVGVELLLRCTFTDPPLHPREFIPALEELRYIVEVTRQAIERALMDLSRWYAYGFDGYVAINLSALHFRTEFDIKSIVTLLDYYQLPRSAIRFELTEGILMDDGEGALRQINRCIESGFIIALDDFGTGYSSLSYLKRFPLQVLKIDKSFVDDINAALVDDALVLTTINLAENLNMSCVAEGVEYPLQADYLVSNGCYFHQGYLYSRPVEAKEILAMHTLDWVLEPGHNR